MTTSIQVRERDLRDVVLATAVAGAAALCWVLSVQRMQGMDMGPGSALGSFSWFVPTWVIMMAAMMLPSALPAIVSFERSRRERAPIGRGVVFAAGYLAVWSAFGAAAFLVYRELSEADPALLQWDRGGRDLVAATAVAAGLYELTPIKRACLTRCRAVGGHADGPALAAALRYGAECLGCSVALMVLLLVIGAMSIAWMVAIAVLLLVQKVSPGGLRSTWASGLGLIALGVWIAIDPGSAPGLTIPM
jgi:predicted metal-binding membrane protein